MWLIWQMPMLRLLKKVLRRGSIKVFNVGTGKGASVLLL